MKITMRHWLVIWLTVGVGSAVAGIWLAHEATTPKAGVGVNREAAPIGRLPANARNVSYYILPPSSYHELDTDEEGFEEWVGKWPLTWKDRSEGPRRVVTWDHEAGRCSGNSR